MEADQITDKKWAVLWYFIEHTSTVQYGSVPDKKGVIFSDNVTGKPRFYSYPARIEKDFQRKISNSEKIRSEISRTWAMEICADLTTLGILGFDMIVAARQKHPTEHYYLKEDLAAFLQVMKIVFEHTPDSALSTYLYSAEYIQNHINEDLVCEILSRKCAEMRRMLHLWQWSPQEAEKVHAFYYAHKEKTRWNPDEKRAPDAYEQSFRDYISTMVRALDPKNRKDLPGFSPTISICLPVLKPGISKDEQIAHLKTLNKKTFEEYPWLETYCSAITEHYQHYQKDHWILPILSLIRASPQALREFLFGDWKPYGLTGNGWYFSEEGSYCMNYPMFTFLFTAINDISRKRLVPNERKIPFVRFRPERRRTSGTLTPPALFEIETAEGLVVCFDASFDTDHTLIGDESGDVVELDNEQNYEVKTWIDVRLQGIALTRDDFPDMDAFVRALQDRSSNVSHHIISRLSNRLQNIIRQYEDMPAEREIIIPQLIAEMNRILAEPGFYEKRIFPGITLTDKGKRLVGEGDGAGSLLFQDSWYFEIFKINRILLEESYPELIKQEKYLASDQYPLVIRSTKKID